MDLEATVYDRLSDDSTLAHLVQDRIYPTVPAEDAVTLPLLVYTVSSAVPRLNLDSTNPLTQYSVDIDVWSVNIADVVAVQDAVAQLLHGWRGDVQGSFMTSRGTQPEDPGHHGQQSFTIWAAA